MAKPSQPAAAIPCLICGYDLAGLDAEGVCPECAAPAGPSVRRNLFELTGIGHGRRVVLGLQLARDAAWAGVICFTAVILAAWTDVTFLKLLGAGLVIAAPVFAAGWWIATRPARSPMRPQEFARPARLARWSVVAVPVLFVFVMASMAGLGGLIGGVLPPTLINLLPLVLLVAIVVRVIFTSEWIGCLATHLGDDDTPRRVRLRVRLAPILVVLFIVLAAGAALVRDLSADGIVDYIGMAASIAVAAAALGTYSWLYIGLIHRGHRVARATLEASSQRESAAEDGGAA